MGNSPPGKREEILGGSGGRMELRVESPRQISHHGPFQNYSPDPNSQVSEGLDLEWSETLLRCVLPAHEVLSWALFHLHTAVCYGKVSKGNCLTWKGKKLVELKTITSPFTLGQDPPREEGTCPQPERSFIHSSRVWSTCHMPGSVLRPGCLAMNTK